MELLLKDLRAFVFARGRQFLEDFIDILSGPKTFLATATVYTSENLARAFSFLVIIYVLVSLLSIFLIPKGVGVDRYAIFSAVYATLFLMVALLLLQLSWLVVGARPSLRRMLLAFLYYVGIGVLIQVVFASAWIMIAAPWDRFLALAKELDALAQDPRAAAAFLDAHPGFNNRVLAIAVVAMIYIAADFAWTVVFWGAFRQIAGTGRIRSTLALFLYFSLSLLLLVLSVLFVQAFAPDIAAGPT